MHFGVWGVRGSGNLKIPDMDASHMQVNRNACDMKISVDRGYASASRIDMG